MASDIKRAPWHIQHATAYLLCYDIPFGKPRPGKDPGLAKYSTASHYLGISDVPFPRRLSDHEKGQGAKLTRHVRAAGIGWELVRIWDDADREQERRLKATAVGHWCPRHAAERVMSQDPVYAEVMTQARARFAIALEAAREQQRAARSKGAGTRAWNRARQGAQAEFRAARRDAAASWLETHPHTRLHQATLRCVIEGTPVVSSLSARRGTSEAGLDDLDGSWPQADLPRNADGSLSRSRTTDADKLSAGLMTSTQQAEHTALRKDAAAGRVPGTERMAMVPAGDAWYLPQPADEPAEPGHDREAVL